MPTIRCFEEMDAWKAARELTRRIYRCSNEGAFRRDFGLKDQIRRAAVSIMSNIAEGFERGGDAEFLQFLSIAKGSTGEVRAQLFVARDQEYLTLEQFEELKDQPIRLGRLIGGLMGYLRESQYRGQKYKRPESRVSSPESE